ncbi:hypothetical protein JCM18899A_25810 [Nocardioides sp. AN3]
MMWLFAIVVVVVLGGVAAVAGGRGEPMAPAYDDRPDTLVPADRPLTAADLRKVRFSVALRGYRMSEVDALLSRLGAELQAAGGPTGPTDGMTDGMTDGVTDRTTTATDHEGAGDADQPAPEHAPERESGHESGARSEPAPRLVDPPPA